MSILANVISAVLRESSGKFVPFFFLENRSTSVYMNQEHLLSSPPTWTWQHVSVFCDVSFEKPALHCFRASEKIKTIKLHIDLRPALFSSVCPAFKERLVGFP